MRSCNQCWHIANNGTFTFMTVYVLWRGFGLHSTLGWWLYCHGQVSFRLNTDGTGFFIRKECHKQSLWNHTTTDHKEGEQLEDQRSFGASSCNSVDGTGQRVQSLIFMIMMMVVIPYAPFSTTTSSRYSVPSTVLKLWITIMQLWKTFPSFGRKVKENWLNLMSAALCCLWFHY